MAEANRTLRSRSLGTRTPQGSGTYDQFVQVLDRMIVERLSQVQSKVGTVTGVNAGDARIAVSGWDDEGVGQQYLARNAGVNYRNGDTVLLVSIAGGEYVVAAKLASSNADRAVVGPKELELGAVTGEHIAPNTIGSGKLSFTPATAADIASATTDMATRTYVSNNFAPKGAYATQADIDTAVSGKANRNHNHTYGDIKSGSGSNAETLREGIDEIKAALTCLNNNSGRKNSKPCTGWITTIS